MTVKATGTGVEPTRRTMEAVKRLEALTQKYIEDGMDRETARQRAFDEMRDNEKGDWRRG